MSQKFEEPQHYTCVYVSILVCMQDICVSAYTLAFDVANLYTVMLYICIYIILVWRFPWTEDPAGVHSIGSQRIRYD